MVSPIDEDAVLPREFYISNTSAAKPQQIFHGIPFPDASTVSQSQQFDDPGQVSLLLPLISSKEYQDFLVSGKSWFQTIGAAAAYPEVSKEMGKIYAGTVNGWNQSLLRINQNQTDYEKSALHQLMMQVENNVKSENDGTSMFSMGMMMLAVSFAGAAGSITGPITQIVTTTMAQLGPLVPSTLAVETAILSTYYATLATFQLALLSPALDKLKEKDKKEKEPPKKEADFAKKYAHMIMSMIVSPSFHRLLMKNVIKKFQNSAKISESDIIRQAATIKVVLLMNALALLYKHETGKLTDIEIAAYLDGKMNLEPGDLKGVLLSMIYTHLSILTPTERKKIMWGVLEYLNSDPSVDSLLDPAKVFSGILGTSTYMPVAAQAI